MESDSATDIVCMLEDKVAMYRAACKNLQAKAARGDTFGTHDRVTRLAG